MGTTFLLHEHSEQKKITCTIKQSNRHSTEMSSSISSPSDTSVSTQIEQQKTQRDEYQKFTVSKMVGPIERVLRDLYNAAVITATAKGTKDVIGIFRKIVIRIPNWTDDEVAREFPENTMDIDACIRMAVRAHATVIALTRNRGCKQVIKVPNTQAFFRKILMEVAMDHDPDLFGTKKLSQRNKLRSWIEACVIRHLIGLVPISLFATDDEDEVEEVKPVQAKPAEEVPFAKAELVKLEEIQEQSIEKTKFAGVSSDADDHSSPVQESEIPLLEDVPALVGDESTPEDVTSPHTPEDVTSPHTPEDVTSPHTPESVISSPESAVLSPSDDVTSSPDFGTVPDSPAVYKKDVKTSDASTRGDDEEMV